MEEAGVVVRCEKCSKGVRTDLKAQSVEQIIEIAEGKLQATALLNCTPTHVVKPVPSLLQEDKLGVEGMGQTDWWDCQKQ